MKKELFRIFNLSIRQNQSAVLSNLYLQVFEGEHTGILFNSFLFFLNIKIYIYVF